MRFSMLSAIVACLVIGSGAVTAQVTTQKPQAQIPKPQPLPPKSAPQAIKPPTAAAPTARVCTDIRDCDRDGEPSIQQGGLDCDDNDPRRRPGKTEIADFEGFDEDCDFTTFGKRDMDQDGEIDIRVFNTDTTGKRYSGTDCDDTRKGIRSMAQELPNKVDDDCNGYVDDLIGEWYPPAQTVRQ